MKLFYWFNGKTFLFVMAESEQLAKEKAEKKGIFIPHYARFREIDSEVFEVSKDYLESFA